MPFRFIDDIATADCAVEIEAGTLPALFEDAAMSLVTCMIDPATVSAKRSWKIELREEDLRGLLYAWLSELVFVRDSENVIFSDFEVNRLEVNGGCSMSATVKGEKIDHDRHDIAVDVKAVTMHMFKIEKKGDIWSAFVIYDL
jgi:SHS2 domain-containing protein